MGWDNFRKTAVLVLIIWAAASAVLCIIYFIYFFILGGRSPAPADIFRALILLIPFIRSGRSPVSLPFVVADAIHGMALRLRAKLRWRS